MVIHCGNVILGDDIKLADTFMSRLIGLMGRKKLETGEGLLLMN